MQVTLRPSSSGAAPAAAAPASAEAGILAAGAPAAAAPTAAAGAGAHEPAATAGTSSTSSGLQQLQHLRRVVEALVYLCKQSSTVCKLLLHLRSTPATPPSGTAAAAPPAPVADPKGKGKAPLPSEAARAPAAAASGAAAGGPTALEVLLATLGQAAVLRSTPTLELCLKLAEQLLADAAQSLDELQVRGSERRRGVA